MSTELTVLVAAAASIGFLHTLLGPDHYVPFIMMSKARNWSQRKTLAIAGIAGVGHVLSSVIIGAIGLGLGVAVTNLEGVEAVRGEIAAWSLIIFGLVYFAWGMKRAMKNKEHVHEHTHENGDTHSHVHGHKHGHMHVHAPGKKSIVPWVLFTIFFFGPCEPLIPILMYPALQQSVLGVVAVVLVFGAVTLATMLGMIVIVSRGLNVMPAGKLGRFIHPISGGTIAACGLAIVFLGI